jgi:hypothetical protein
MSELRVETGIESPNWPEENGFRYEMPADSPIEADDNGHYRIRNDQEAEWALRKIKEAEDNKEFWKAHYDQQYKSVCFTNDLTINNMRSLLQTYFATVPHKISKTEESYGLPSGKIYMKQQEPEFDTKSLLDWLKVNGKTEFIEYKESAKWSDFKKTLAKDPEGKFAVAETEDGLRAVTKDGEITPIPVTLRQPEFKVKV